LKIRKSLFKFRLGVAIIAAFATFATFFAARERRAALIPLSFNGAWAGARIAPTLDDL
jgi:hypothetical protein